MQPMIGGGVFFSIGSGAGPAPGNIVFVEQFDFESPSSFNFSTDANNLVVIVVTAFESAEGVAINLNSADLTLNDGPELINGDSHGVKIFWAVGNFSGLKTVTWSGISSAHHVTVLVFQGQSASPAGDSGGGNGNIGVPIQTSLISSNALLVGAVASPLEPGSTDISVGAGFIGSFFQNGINPNTGVEYALASAPARVAFDGQQDEFLAIGMSFSAA